MPRNTPKRIDALRDEIRRQFGSPGTLRHLRSLPALQVDPDLPDDFRDLLARLDRAEMDSQAGAGR
jgi:hypothetical protein